MSRAKIVTDLRPILVTGHRDKEVRVTEDANGVEEEMLERRLSERVLNAWREFFRSFPN